MNPKKVEHLEWIYDRLVHVHKEKENTDYMIKFREVIDSAKVHKHKTIIDGDGRFYCDDPEC